MKNGKFAVNIGEKEYELTFNINTIDTIQEEMDKPFSEVMEMLDEQKTVYKAFRCLMWAMINETIMIRNDDNGTNEPLLKLHQVGAMLDFDTIFNLKNEILINISNNISDGEESNTPRESGSGED